MKVGETMRVRVDNGDLIIRPGMWLKDRSGKCWQWCVNENAGVLTDGSGQILRRGGCVRFWHTRELTDAIARGELTPEADAATVEVGSLPVNTVFNRDKQYWQVESKNMIGMPPVLDSVRIRAWPSLVEGKPSFKTLDPSTFVTPIGVPVVEDKT